MARFQLYSVALVLLAQYVASQITFTGDAYLDFIHVGGEPNRTKSMRPNDNKVGVSQWMQARNRTTGWDLKSTNLQYDYKNDILYVALDCWVICGDADGDGNPGSSVDAGADTRIDAPPDSQCIDTENQVEQESITMTIWTQPPATYTGSNTFNQYFPDIVIGDNFLDGLDQFKAHTFDPRSYCRDADGNDYSEDECNSILTQVVGVPGDFMGPEIQQLIMDNSTAHRAVRPMELFAYPNASTPDIEFTVYDFSQYGSFDFTPGIDKVRFGYSCYLGSLRDCCGEEQQFPYVHEFGCLNSDVCGVCGGDNSTCKDCFGVPNGGAHYDACGVCGGNNSTCWDCGHNANGDWVYDICGVCNGNSDTCFDCAYIPNGPNVYDECGVCGGDSDTCLDCMNIPNGGHVYDECGVCGGFNDCDCWFTDTITFYAEDTYVELAHREKNHGNEDILEVKYNRSRTLVQFQHVRTTIQQIHKFKSPNQTTEILSAKLKFNIAKYGAGWDDADIALHQIGEFTELEATWDCSAIDPVDGCCKSWRMISLPPQVEASYTLEPSGVAQIWPHSHIGHLEFDLLDEVFNLVHNETLCGQDRLSYILKKVCERGPGAVWFWSCESAHSQCPRLIVDVRTKCPVKPKPELPVNPCTGETEEEHEGHGHL